MVVQVTDANGKVYGKQTNAAGNFFGYSYETPALATPASARVMVDNHVRFVCGPQSSGACNGCHSADGKNGAPGRLVGP